MKRFKPGDHVTIVTHGKYWFTDFGSKGVVVAGYSPNYTIRWYHLAKNAIGLNPVIGGILDSDLVLTNHAWDVFYKSL